MKRISKTLSPSFTLLGLRIDLLGHEQILSQMDEWIRARSCGHNIVFANTHVVMERLQNAALAEAVDAATLVVPDGMPLVVAARSRGFGIRERADGPGMMRKALTSEDCRSWRHYFYGSTPETLDALLQRYPEVKVAGIYSPPFRPLTSDEEQQAVDAINASQADVLWVGLGCPKQERWMFEHADHLHVPVLLGVGQAFDILAGTKKRAPVWMQKVGMEWLYRLLREPRRLGRRYLLYNPWFVWLYMREQSKLLFYSMRGSV